MNTASVAVADDDGEFRAVLAGLSGIDLVAATGIGRTAVRDAVRSRPDVLVIDPRGGGIEAMAEVVRTLPGTAVLVVTEAADDGSVRAAFRAGARGYLRKPVEPSQLGQAIANVAKGAAVFDAFAARLVMASFTGPPARFSGLTSRQLEVLELVGAGLPNSAIARKLALNPKTVRNHVSALFAGLGVPDRAQAILVARDAGLTVP